MHIFCALYKYVKNSIDNLFPKWYIKGKIQQSKAHYIVYNTIIIVTHQIHIVNKKC